MTTKRGLCKRHCCSVLRRRNYGRRRSNYKININLGQHIHNFVRVAQMMHIAAFPLWLLLTATYVLVVCLAFQEWGTQRPWPTLGITRRCSGCFKFYRHTTQCHTCHETHLCDECHWACYAQLVASVHLGDQAYMRIDGNLNCLNRQCDGSLVAPDILSAQELVHIGTHQRANPTYCAV